MEASKGKLQHRVLHTSNYHGPSLHSFWAGTSKLLQPPLTLPPPGSALNPTERVKLMVFGTFDRLRIVVEVTLFEPTSMIETRLS